MHVNTNQDTYIQLGKRLDSFGRTQCKAERPIDWAALGHFSPEAAEVDGVPKSMIECRILAQKKELTQEVVGDDPGPFTDIINNFSRFSAQLQTTRGTYTLQSLFPRLCRSLLRRPSEINGAVGMAVAAAEGIAQADEGDIQAADAGQQLGGDEEPPSPE